MRTLIIVGGENRKETTGRANLALECVIRRVKGMGLKVSPEKSEGMFFFKDKKIEQQEEEEGREEIKMEGTRIKMGQTIKYLGLYIDRNWTFEEHFEVIGRKMEGATDGLCKLLPNVGGPGEVARRLYAGVIHAIGLYGGSHA